MKGVSLPTKLALRSTYDESKATTSGGEKPASLKRARMLVTLSTGYQGLILLFNDSGHAYQMALGPADLQRRPGAGGGQGRI